MNSSVSLFSDQFEFLTDLFKILQHVYRLVNSYIFKIEIHKIVKLLS